MLRPQAHADQPGRDALQQRVEELEARIALQEREYFAAPIETD